MADAENTLPPSKKRAAGRELSRDNPGLDDEEEGSEQETGTFKRASEEVLANRRIVKVRRNQTASAPSAPSSNPFAAIRLVPPANSPFAPATLSNTNELGKTASKEVVSQTDMNKGTEKREDDSIQQPESKVDETKAFSNTDDEKNEKAVPNAGEEKNEGADEVRKSESIDAKVAEDEETENEAKKETEIKGIGNNETTNAETASVNSFQQLSSSQNAFTGLVGTGFSNSAFSFGSIMKNDQPTFPTFSFGTNGNPSLFSNPGTSDKEGTKTLSMQEVPVETGEENEKAMFTADSVLFEFLEGGWKERGKGELKVNVSTTGTKKARLVMRARGNYRLILNASLFHDMKLTNMEKKGITFACVNGTGEGKDGLSTFALKFRDASIVEEFRSVVTQHKGNASAPTLKTPENSPKASDE